MNTQTVALRIELREGREFRVAPMSREGATRLAAHIIEDAPPGFVRFVHIEPQDQGEAPPRHLVRSAVIATICWAIVGVGLALLLTGCASIHEAHVRRLQKEPFGNDLLACETQMKQTPNATAERIAEGVVQALVFPIIVSGARGPITLCMGDKNWTPERPDTVWPWRPMTPAERESWPTSRAAIIEYERARGESIRPGGTR